MWTKEVEMKKTGLKLKADRALSIDPLGGEPLEARAFTST